MEGVTYEDLLGTNKSQNNNEDNLRKLLVEIYKSIN